MGYQVNSAAFKDFRDVVDYCDKQNKSYLSNVPKFFQICIFFINMMCLRKR